jgi:hypothetical protein
MIEGKTYIALPFSVASILLAGIRYPVVVPDEKDVIKVQYKIFGDQST